MSEDRGETKEAAIGSVISDVGSVVSDVVSVVADVGSAVTDVGSVVADVRSVVPDVGSVVPDNGSVVADVGSAIAHNGSTRSGHCGDTISTESLADYVKVKVKPENVSNEVAVKKEPTPADETSNGGEFSLSTTNLTLIRNQQQQQEVELLRAESGVKVETEEAKKPKLTNGHHERRDH
jgi:hypothetical protein